MDVSRDGRWIASSDDQNRMHLYDASTNRLLRSYDAAGSEDGLGFVSAFSPDSRQLAVILDGQALHRAGAPAGPGHHAADDEARLPRRQAGVGGRRRVQRRRSLPGRHRAYGQLAGDEDPSEAPGYAVVWDLRSPSTPPVRVPTGTDPQAMALSPDGRILYTDWPLTAYEVATGKQIWRREDVTIW